MVTYTEPVYSLLYTATAGLVEMILLGGVYGVGLKPL